MDEYTVVGYWDEDSNRVVIGAIEGTHRIVAIKDHHEPLFVEHVKAESADAATDMFHGKHDEAMAELRSSEVPC
jgi:hypothetical protein